jgi:signal transduction histidine kinase
MLVVVAALAVRSYLAVDRDLTEAALSRRAAVASLAAATVRERLNRLTDLGRSLATRVRFREMVIAARWEDAAAILGGVPADFPVIDRVFITDSAGILRSDVPAAPEVRGVDFSHRDWYQGVSRGWTPYVSRAYRRSAAPQMYVVAVALPIAGARGGVGGVLVLQFTLDAIFDWLAEVDAGPNGSIYVVDQAGGVAFRSGAPRVDTLLDLSSAPAAERALRGETGVATLFDPLANGDRLAAYAPVADIGWGVIVQQSERAAFAARNRRRRGVAGAYAIIFVALAAIAYLVSRTVVERRQAITAARARAELERRVEERTAELEAANRELEAFSYSVSHDLRGPLRAIDGFARILEEEHAPRLNDEGRATLGTIRRNVGTMGQLIDDLLELSRLGRKPLAAGPLDMGEMVRQVYAELSSQAGGRVPPLVVGDLPPGTGDRVLVGRAWTNLLANAIKFTGTTPAAEIRVGGAVDGAEVVYSVADNGVGFDDTYRDKLFGVFQRLHRAREFPGTGIGLAIVHRVVTRHGGRVWAEGKVGAGATFWFTLPHGAGAGDGLPGD